jgi:hypothetical protein
VPWWAGRIWLPPNPATPLQYIKIQSPKYGNIEICPIMDLWHMDANLACGPLTRVTSASTPAGAGAPLAALPFSINQLSVPPPPPPPQGLFKAQPPMPSFAPRPPLAAPAMSVPMPFNQGPPMGVAPPQPPPPPPLPIYMPGRPMHYPPSAPTPDTGRPGQAAAPRQYPRATPYGTGARGGVQGWRGW